MATAPIPMGIGKIGFKNVIFKRKFQWTFEVRDICGGQNVPVSYVKMANRPKLSIEEKEINHLNGKKFIPGKGTWNEISVSYYDVATVDNGPLFSWLASVYNFTDSIKLQMGSQSGDYSGTGIIQMYDGCGQLLDRWTLLDMWPKEINFGELDYSSSDECLIELSLRFASAKYEPICPAFPINVCCSPCNTAGVPAGNSGGGRVPSTGSNTG
jgi:hypothetical protein